MYKTIAVHASIQHQLVHDEPTMAYLFHIIAIPLGSPVIENNTNNLSCYVYIHVRVAIATHTWLS